MLGVSEERALGRTVIECTMSAALDDAVRAALQGGDAAEDGEASTADLDLLYPRPRRIRAVVSASGEGEDRAAVVVLQDQTRAYRLDLVRRDFVANVSHELRTPVTGIQTLAENLLEGAMDDPHIAREFLEHILHSAHRLVALVDDLLGLARAESKPTVVRAPVAVAPVARAVVAALDHAITEKRLDVGVDVPEDTMVWADPESLRQILSNLVDNAVKYTPEGGTVDVSAGRAGEGGLVDLRVSDTGIGIPTEHQDRVFERFYRVDRARSREVGGTGLGLSIVKHLVESMGGSVALASTPGHGSTFTVTLPAPAEDHGSEERPSGADLTVS
jgi:two-component system phosphate regulon sensor histidine kinase PhoR